MVRDDVCGAGVDAFPTLEAVGVDEAVVVAATLVGRQLHGTHASAVLALSITLFGHEDALEDSRIRSALRRYPRRERPHRAERAPRARRVDEGENDAHDGRHYDNRPKHTAHLAPIAPREIKLYTEHREDEKHHEEAETEGAHELGYRTVRRVFRQQAVIHATARTAVPAPKASTPYRRQHRAEHTDDSRPPYYREEPPEDKISEENPIKRGTRRGEMPMKTFLSHSKKSK